MTTKRGQTQEDTHSNDCAADILQSTLENISSKPSVYIKVGYKNEDAENQGALTAAKHITLERTDEANQARAHEWHRLEEGSE